MAKPSSKKRRRRSTRQTRSRGPRDEKLAAALANHQAGDIGRAEQLYLEVVSEDPAQSVALHNLGLITHQKGNVDKARELLERALVNNGSDVAAWNNLGGMYQELGRLNDAARAYREAVSLSPAHPNTLYNLGWVLNDSGDTLGAVRCFRELVRTSPGDAENWHSLGVVQAGADDKEAAESAYRKAVSLEPGFAAAWFGLGNTLRQQDKLEEARDALATAVGLQPDFPEARNNLGNVYRELGDPEQAIASFKQSLVTTPQHLETYLNLASVLVHDEDLPAAAAALEEAVGLFPDDYRAHLSLGEFRFMREEFQAAEVAILRAIEINGTESSSHSALGKTLVRLERAVEAEAACRRAIELDAASADAYANLGTALRFQGHLSEAMSAYQTALERDPSYAEVYNNLGMAYVDEGNFERANQCYRTAVDIDPDMPEVLVNLAMSRRYTETDSREIEDLETFLEHQTLRRESRAAVHFALGKMRDDRAEYDKAFHHYSLGNDIKADRVRFHGTSHVKSLRALRETYSPALFSRFAGFGVSSELPVFIIGMPRSGTTLVEQILASHPEIYAAGELTHIWEISKRLEALLGEPYPECINALTAETSVEFAREYLVNLKCLSPVAVRAVNKMPYNFLHLGLIAILFPGARIIHCRRDARDVCLSNFFQLYIEAQYFTYRLSDLALYYNEYAGLMTHWRKSLPMEIYEISYEELVDDLEHQTRGLLEHMGLDWDERCLQFYDTRRAIQTASNWQVRQPLYRRSRGRWKCYEAYLGELFDALETCEGL